MKPLLIFLVLLRTALGRYLWNILIWLDQGVNVVFLGGSADETVSSVTGKYWRQFAPLKWLRIVLNAIDTDHCEKAIEADEGSSSVWAAIARKRNELNH